MKPFPERSIIALSLFLSLPLFAQEASFPDITINAEYKGPHKVPIGSTKSIPPHVFYRTKGYNFHMTLSIIAQRASTLFDSSLGIVCILPDYTVKKFFLEYDNMINTSENQYHYSFPVRIQRSGWIKVFIASREEMQSETDVTFYHGTSNKESIYLHTQ